MTPKAVNIIQFEEKYANDFAKINFEWLEKYFYIEDYDREVLTNPQQHILNDGGQILFAITEGVAIGTVALMKRGEGLYELTKMGVLEEYQGLKIGKQLMQACFDYAKEKDWNCIFLDSSRKLTPAITMYRKMGFKEIPVPKDSPYERCDIRMELCFK